MDLTLPPDLGRLTPLLDGTHTLLELSRETLAEPMRVGAFALFLREMGWARLHEMPPLDRQALDLALTPEPEPVSPPLPEPPADTPPSLFETIQEAARPTTNLEHLSKALDEEPFPGPRPRAPLPARRPPGSGPPGVRGARGDGPGPGPHPLRGTAPPAGGVGRELRVTLKAPLEVPEDLPPPPATPELPAPSPLRRILLGLLVAVLLAAGFLWLRRRGGAPKSKPVPAAPVKVEPAKPALPKAEPGPGIAVPPPKVEPAEPPKAEPVKEAPKPEPKPETKPEPKPKPKPEAKAVSATLAERLDALRTGDLDKAVAQGAAHVKEAPAQHWALRLEIACQGETIRRVSELFKDQKPDLFLLPMTLRDGRGCYQVLYGNFPTKEAAEKESKKLPPAFMADRNRPRAFRFAEIPKDQ